MCRTRYYKHVAPLELAERADGGSRDAPKSVRAKGLLLPSLPSRFEGSHFSVVPAGLMTVWDLIPALKRPGYSRRSLRDGENELGKGIGGCTFVDASISKGVKKVGRPVGARVYEALEKPLTPPSPFARRRQTWARQGRERVTYFGEAAGYRRGAPLELAERADGGSRDAPKSVRAKGFLLPSSLRVLRAPIFQPSLRDL